MDNKSTSVEKKFSAAQSNKFHNADVLIGLPNFSFCKNEKILKKYFSTGVFFFSAKSRSKKLQSSLLEFYSNYTSLKKANGNAAHANVVKTDRGSKVLACIAKGAMLQHNSQKIKEGDVFVALPGERVHGLQFFKEVQKKASLIIADVEHFREYIGVKKTRSASKRTKNLQGINIEHLGNVSLMLVEGVESFANSLACHFYGNPSEKQEVVGITGTNGKTSIAEYLAATYLRLYRKRTVAIIGTLGTQFYVNNKWSRLNGSNTTPVAIELQQILAFLLSQGVHYVVMEISSHALALERIAGLELSSVVFTRLTRDHTDFHKSMREYYNAKMEIFSLLSTSTKKNKFAVVASSLSSYGFDQQQKSFPFPVLRLSEILQKKTTTDLTNTFNFSSNLLKSTESTLETQLLLRLRYASNEAQRNFSLLGMFAGFQGENVAYALLHSAAKLAYKKLAIKPPTPKIKLFDSQRLAEKTAEEMKRIESIPSISKIFSDVLVPGRMMRVHPFPIFIDYAHTSDALRRALMALQGLPKRDVGGRLVVLFGCGGERDKTKRAEMGAIAAKLADVCIVTSDNPRNEDPKKIIAHIVGGISSLDSKKKKSKGACIVLIEERIQAIQTAVQYLHPGDVLLIAGKGHETVQITANGKSTFNEREIIKSSVAKLFQSEFSFNILKKFLSNYPNDRWAELSKAFTHAALKKPVDQNVQLQKAKGVFYDTRKWNGEEIFFSFDGMGDSGIFHLSNKHFKKLKTIVVSSKQKKIAVELLEKYQASMVSKNDFALPQLIIVRNVFSAFANLAKHKMQNILALYPTSKVVGVTGSAGKSSLKEGLGVALKAFLSVKKPSSSNCAVASAGGTCAVEVLFGVFVSKGNFNNHIGLPQNIFLVNKPCQYYVFEMGMNHTGEISALASIITPHYGFITSIMAAHIENFKAMENIAAAKAEFLQWGFYKKSSEEKNILFLPSNIAFNSYFKQMAKKYFWTIVEIPMEKFKSEVGFNHNKNTFFSSFKVVLTTPPKLNASFSTQSLEFPTALNNSLKKRIVSEGSGKNNNDQYQPLRKTSTVSIVGIYPHGVQLFSALYIFIQNLAWNRLRSSDENFKSVENYVDEKNSFVAHRQALKAMKDIPEQLMPRRFAQLSNSPVIIDDAYNANPTSMMEALPFVAELAKKIKAKNKNSRKYIMVLGDMLELGKAGEHYHDSVVHEALSLVHKANNFYFLFVGKNFTAAFKRFFIESQDAFDDGDMLKWESAKFFTKPTQETAVIFDTKYSKQSKKRQRNAQDQDIHDAMFRTKVVDNVVDARVFLNRIVVEEDLVFFKASNGMEFTKLVNALLIKFRLKTRPNEQ